MSIRRRLAIASTSTLRVRGARAIGKDGWVAILRATGLDEAAMHRWHIEFERMAPDAHQDFLESLGLSKAEITRIRQWSRPGKRRSARA